MSPLKQKQHFHPCPEKIIPLVGACNHQVGTTTSYIREEKKRTTEELCPECQPIAKR